MSGGMLSSIVIFLHNEQGSDRNIDVLRELFQNTKIGIIKASKISLVVNGKLSMSLSSLVREFKVEVDFVSENLNLSRSHTKEVKVFYKEIFKKYNPRFSILLGWKSKVPKEFCHKNILNVHLGPLMDFDRALYGKKLYNAIFEAYLRGDIDTGYITLHKIKEDYNTGDIVFKVPVYFSFCDEPEEVVNRIYKTFPFWLSYAIKNYSDDLKGYSEIIG